jgi:hypothetical protein
MLIQDNLSASLQPLNPTSLSCHSAIAAGFNRHPLEVSTVVKSIPSK